MPVLHLVNWNVNGFRSMMKKNFVHDIQSIQPDILCLQETKAAAEEVKSLCAIFPEYKVYANSSKARKGYSGTAILTKLDPVNITFDLNKEEHDQEGRVITAEFAEFFLVTVYTPNSGDGLKRLDYRQEWDKEFKGYIVALSKKKPVIVAGDLNVAHQSIDIARAKENYNKSAGYTQKEIDGFEDLLKEGFIDTFRYFHPAEVKYTYWNNFFNSRARNVGWRIDYFLITNDLKDKVVEATISNQYMGSDHCPIELKIKIQ